MPPSKIMIIRHAEKPPQSGRPHGVRARGASDSQSLTTRGWERAGALARFFAPRGDAFAHPALSRPDAIIAAGRDAGASNASRRCVQTARPLAQLLGVEITERFVKGDEAAMVEDALSRSGVLLIVWAHEDIAGIFATLPGAPVAPAWPDDRFDMVWCLDRDGARWRLTQVPQLLLAGDRDDPIAAA